VIVVNDSGESDAGVLVEVEAAVASLLAL